MKALMDLKKPNQPPMAFKKTRQAKNNYNKTQNIILDIKWQ